MFKRKNPIIAPSILGADFSELKKEVELCNNSKAEWLHLDIMDQQFVPNLSFGPGLVKSIRNHSNLFFDVHLMVSNPFDICLLYTSPSPRDRTRSRMPSSA